MEVGSKKIKTITKVTTHNEDMRNLVITVKGKFDAKKIYELGLKKVISQSGADFPAENKIPLRISYVAPAPDSLSVL